MGRAGSGLNSMAITVMPSVLKLRHHELQLETKNTRNYLNVLQMITTKSEVNVCGADVPAEMDGGLKKKDIQSKYDKEIKAEMEHRRIRYPEGEDGKPKPFKKLTMKEKRDLLVLDEIRVLAAEGKARDGIEPRNVKYIVPQSTEMKDLAARINSS